MNALSAETLLDIWDGHQHAHPIRQALALLDAAWPEVGADLWTHAPIGERDGCLLLLYEHLFGGELQTVVCCPQCGERLESSFHAADIRAQPPALPTPHEPLQLHERDCEIVFRLPDSEDLLSLAGGDCAEAAATELLERCLGEVRRDGKRIDAAQLPAELADRVAAEMAKCDPGAALRVELDCPACSHVWSPGFDIVSYLWGELDDWAQRLLADVHQLARHYGWSEHDILALSPTRRRLYLDMVQA